MLEIKHLTKRFGGLVAIDDLSLRIEQGDCVGIVGPNGAGKTTLFDLINGFLSVERGTIITLDVVDNVAVHLLRWSPGTFGEIAVRWRSVARKLRVARETAKEVLERVGLDQKAAVEAGRLSYGERKLLALACCVAPNPRLVLLDEPFAGIAEDRQERVALLVRDLVAAGGSAAIIEHNLEAVSGVCQRLIALDKGRCIAAGSLEQLRQNPEVIRRYLYGE